MERPVFKVTRELHVSLPDPGTMTYKLLAMRVQADGYEVNDQTLAEQLVSDVFLYGMHAALASAFVEAEAISVVKSELVTA